MSQTKEEQEKQFVEHFDNAKKLLAEMSSDQVAACVAGHMLALQISCGPTGLVYGGMLAKLVEYSVKDARG